MAREDEVVDAGSCSDEGSDAELLARSARGDRRAFDAIITRYGPMALRVAGRMALDRQSAEDIAQEAMVRIWQRAGEFDACRARLSTWLYRIVINLCIDSRRRPQPLPLPQGFDAVDPSPNAAETREVDERSGALARAIDELPSRQRAALTLIYDEELSGAEAAQVLGVSAKAVERLLARARARLRELLVADGRQPEAGT
ncbi:MAG: sigma-70 family RNA polymerase sigma factor [Steroidobacteraceae bacterium]